MLSVEQIDSLIYNFRERCYINRCNIFMLIFEQVFDFNGCEVCSLAESCEKCKYSNVSELKYILKWWM